MGDFVTMDNGTPTGPRPLTIRNMDIIAIHSVEPNHTSLVAHIQHGTFAFREPAFALPLEVSGLECLYFEVLAKDHSGVLWVLPHVGSVEGGFVRVRWSESARRGCNVEEVPSPKGEGGFRR